MAIQRKNSYNKKVHCFHFKIQKLANIVELFEKKKQNNVLQKRVFLLTKEMNQV